MQKLSDILFKAYLKDNKEIMKLVTKYADDKKNKKKRYGMTELEAEDIMSRIEEYSPLSDIDKAFKEIDKDE